MPHVPEGFDPNVAHIVDADGNIFQALAPAQTAEVVVGEAEAGADSDDQPIFEPVIATINLPRQWDEAATLKAMSDG